MRFLAIFLSLVCWIDLILHILMVLNVFQLSATIPGHEGSFKSHEKVFLHDPKSQNEVYWAWGCWIDLILHILMVLNVFKLLATVPGREGSFKSHKNAFLNAKNGQNLCIISIIKCKRAPE